MAKSFSKLRGRIVEIYGTQYEFARVLGTSVQSLTSKLNRRTEFTISEIKRWVTLLEIPDEEITSYFFAD